MSGLTEFLLARYDEEEAIALDVVATLSNDYAASFHPDIGRHIYRWSPARVLAECKVKRGAIDAAWGAHEQIENEWGTGKDRDRMGALNDNPRVLRYLALPYADHPDYREEWRP